MPPPGAARPERARTTREHALRGALTMGGSQFARIVLQAMSIVVLARLLSPSDYGLIAMVTAIVGVAEVLRDFGLTFASVQAKVMTRELQDNLFWLNALAGLVLSVAAYFAAVPIADLYGEPRLVPITHVVCWVFLINGISAQARADLNRRLRFGTLALGDTGAVLIGFVATLVAALLGAGYWALVVQLVLPTILATVFYLVAAGWIPGRYHREVSTMAMLRYGASLVANQVLNYAMINSDSVIIGTRLGAASLGIYDRAFQLLALPLSKLSVPATKVALPLLSRVQAEPERFRRLLLRGQTVVVHPVLLLFSVMVGFGEILIPLVLGGQWHPAVVPFQILCFGGCLNALTVVTNWAFMATGSMRAYLKVTAVTAPVTVACMYVGSRWGIDGVAAGFTLGTAAYWPMSLWWLRRQPQVPGIVLLRRGLRALLWHGAPGVLAAWLVHRGGASAASGGIALAGYLVLWLGILAALPPLRDEVRVILDLVRRRLHRAAAPDADLSAGAGAG
ncbi:lipopolysaccharide biosynthesis protein [Nocardioides terrisoli]|uniref:lipopolysaccharide biosynthesis protein n=1 Tax=Nocardioides terrisoli TaxID=3388267 RepID=UPI00287B5DA8|nr:lipopolysaccharide biosynthesis protein [Nocardioides marmorisolisilvae]